MLFVCYGRPQKGDTTTAVHCFAASRITLSLPGDQRLLPGTTTCMYLFIRRWYSPEVLSAQIPPTLEPHPNLRSLDHLSSCFCPATYHTRYDTLLFLCCVCFFVHTTAAAAVFIVPLLAFIPPAGTPLYFIQLNYRHLSPCTTPSDTHAADDTVVAL